MLPKASTETADVPPALLEKLLMTLTQLRFTDGLIGRVTAVLAVNDKIISSECDECRMHLSVQFAPSIR